MSAPSPTGPNTPDIERLAVRSSLPDAADPYLALMDMFSHVHLELDWRPFIAL